ncbi:amino acid ABC transporter substrate-binding protein [Hahella sp. CCB-MM4]|nr:amino acid ABC transporter substrate-binding protein [Hahella sp. CCB-MM4]
MLFVISMAIYALSSSDSMADSPTSPVSGLQLYISEYPPFCFTEDGQAKGLAVDVVREIMGELQVDFPIQSVPWKRGLKNISGDGASALFTITRTAEREPLFKWVGPITISNLVFFSRRDSGIDIKTLADARQVDHIGTVQGYSAEKYLLGEGFKNLVSNAGSDKTNPTKLIKGYLDLWVSVDVVGFYLARQEGIKPSQLKIVYELKKQPKYIAFSLATPDETVLAWQSALDHLRADGRLDNIALRWMTD